jgi:hypothetical protein
MSISVPRAPHAADVRVLKALGRELSGLVHAGLKLQDLIGAEVRTGKLGASAMQDAQAADLLSQQLQELARFLEAYADAIEGEEADPLASAASGLVLGALAERLRNPDGAIAAVPAANGDLEMF